MFVKDYLAAVTESINEYSISGFIVISEITSDFRSDKIGIIRGKIVFVDESTLFLALFHFVWVSYFYYLIATLGFTTLKFKSPVTKKTTTLKYRNVLNPLAFALAA